MSKKKIITGMVLICAALVLAAGISTFIRARNTSASNACINNLRQIDGAKQQWADEHTATSNAVPTWDDLRPYLGRGQTGDLPICPQGGKYILGRVADSPRCPIGGQDHTIQ
jgi:hypothetical protein